MGPSTSKKWTLPFIMSNNNLKCPLRLNQQLCHVDRHLLFVDPYLPRSYQRLNWTAPFLNFVKNMLGILCLAQLGKSKD